MAETIIAINTNVTTNEHFDRFGQSFRGSEPGVSYRSNFKLRWQLFTDSPDADMAGADPANWSPVNLAGCGAIATCDNDFRHRVAGTLLAAIESGTTANVIEVKTSAAATEIPSSGLIALYDANGSVTDLEYSAAEAISDGFRLTLAAPFAAESDYPAGTAANVSQEPLFQSMYLPEESDPAVGLFVFECFAYSKRLAALADTSTGKNITVQGLELLPFMTTDDGVLKELPAYLIDTFTLTINLAEVGTVIPEYTGDTSELLAALASLVVHGLDIQVHNTERGWHDYTAEDLEDPEYAHSLTAYRIRLTGSTGDYSLPIPLIHGTRGEDGHNAPQVQIQYSANGTDWVTDPANADYIRFSVDGGSTWGDNLYTRGEKGNTGSAAGFTEPVATAVGVPSDYPAKATVTASGEATAKRFDFAFEIPKGEKGDRGEAFKFDATGTLADRAQYDAEAKGFAYLATDDGNVYIKNSDTSGDWSDPIPFKGDKGDEPFHLRGAWAESTQYALNDAVTYNGSFYVAVAATTSVPGTDGTWTEYISKGEPGAPGQALEANYIDITAVTDGYLVIAAETIPVSVEINNAVYPVLGMIKDSDNFKIPASQILAAANLAEYSGTWRVWRAGGKPGVDGVDGADGQDGADGVMSEVTIGNNGNWYINGVDTHKKATGQGSNVVVSPTPPVTPYNGMIWVQSTNQEYINIDPIEVVVSATEPVAVNGTIWIESEA